MTFKTKHELLLAMHTTSSKIDKLYNKMRRLEQEFAKLVKNITDEDQLSQTINSLPNNTLIRIRLRERLYSTERA